MVTSPGGNCLLHQTDASFPYQAMVRLPVGLQVVAQNEQGPVRVRHIAIKLRLNPEYFMNI